MPVVRTVAALSVVVATAALGAPPAWASGAVTVEPDPVVVSASQAASATLTLTVEAAAPLPAGIDAVTIELTPASGGVSFTQAPAGCTIGPRTVVACPWSPAAAGDRITLTATILVAPGVPAQTVPVHWAVTSTGSQQPVDEGGASLALVTSIPTPAPTTTSGGGGGTDVPVPTAVPAGEGLRDAPSSSTPILAITVVAAVGAALAAAARGRSRRGSRR